MSSCFLNIIWTQDPYMTKELQIIFPILYVSIFLPKVKMTWDTWKFLNLITFGIISNLFPNKNYHFFLIRVVHFWFSLRKVDYKLINILCSLLRFWSDQWIWVVSHTLSNTVYVLWKVPLPTSNEDIQVGQHDWLKCLSQPRSWSYK